MIAKLARYLAQRIVESPLTSIVINSIKFRVHRMGSGLLRDEIACLDEERFEGTPRLHTSTCQVWIANLARTHFLTAMTMRLSKSGLYYRRRGKFSESRERAEARSLGCGVRPGYERLL